MQKPIRLSHISFLCLKELVCTQNNCNETIASGLIMFSKEYTIRSLTPPKKTTYFSHSKIKLMVYDGGPRVHDCIAPTRLLDCCTGISYKILIRVNISFSLFHLCALFSFQRENDFYSALFTHRKVSRQIICSTLIWTRLRDKESSRCIRPCKWCKTQAMALRLLDYWFAPATRLHQHL